MASLSAENYFKKGLSALVDHNHEDAAAFFRKALDLDRERNKRQPDMRYLSYYGLSLAKSQVSTSTAIQACRTAITKQRRDPVLFLNLGRVYAIAGKLSLAADSFERGLRLAPENKVLRRELAQIDRRHRPCVPVLSRNHPLNRWLGRLRSSLWQREPRSVAGVTVGPRL